MWVSQAPIIVPVLLLLLLHTQMAHGHSIRVTTGRGGAALLCPMDREWMRTDSAQ